MINIGQLIWDSQNGLSFPEGRIESETKKIVTQLKSGESVTIGCALIFNQIRIAIKDGELPAMPIVVDGKLVEINKYGRLQVWPRGFCDLLDKQLVNLIKLTKEEKDAN